MILVLFRVHQILIVQRHLSGVDSFPKLTHLAVVEQRRSSRWKNTTSLQTRFLKV